MQAPIASNFPVRVDHPTERFGDAVAADDIGYCTEHVARFSAFATCAPLVVLDEGRVG
jgi:hypothetical protein